MRANYEIDLVYSDAARDVGVPRRAMGLDGRLELDLHVLVPSTVGPLFISPFFWGELEQIVHELVVVDIYFCL